MLDKIGPLVSEPSHPPDAALGQAIKPFEVVIAQVKEQQAACCNTLEQLAHIRLTIGRCIREPVQPPPLRPPNVKEPCQPPGEQSQISRRHLAQLFEPA